MLARPPWPDPATGHLRGIGGVRRRNLPGFDSWVGEASLVCGIPAMALDLPRWLPGRAGTRVALVRKACYFDGLINGRFEFLFRVTPEPASFAEVGEVARTLLDRPVRVPRFDGGKGPRPLGGQSGAVARLWAHATVKRNANPLLKEVRAGRAFAVAESSAAIGEVPSGAPAGVELRIDQTGKPFELFIIHPPFSQVDQRRTPYRQASRTLRTYLLRMLQDVEALSQISAIPGAPLDDDRVQAVFNEYTRHIIRSRAQVEDTTGLFNYCYAAFARLYPGRVEGLRRQVVSSGMRPNVKAKVLDFLKEVESAQTFIQNLVQGDYVMGDKYEDITATGQGIAIGRNSSARVSDSVNQSLDPQLISALKDLAAKIRESGNPEAEVEAEVIEAAAKKAEAGDEKGAIGHLKKAAGWALGLGTTVGSVVLSAFLKSHLGIG
ncbi:MAG TPA: hypothetical protein VEW25_06275 [Allosphingosinicella sp.]|nr:hypothetical protein [Allosphingosinicella sp.]